MATPAQAMTMPATIVAVGAVPMRMTPGAFGDYLRADIAKWAGVIRSAGLKAE